ncbi:MAG: dipeptidase [Melioribacteraceae bacterium]
MQKRIITVILIFLTINLLASDDKEQNKMLKNKAIELSKKFLIIDTHIDIPYRLKNKWADISLQTDEGHFDYPRAVKGGLDAAFMSIYIPSRYEDKGGSVELADSLIDMVENIARANPKKFAVAHSTNDVLKYFNLGIISFPLGMENGTPIEGSIKNLKHFYKRGIRYITLTHAKANHICDSSYDPNKKWNGLSPFGKTLVTEMNKIGIMVDISHVSDSTFYQVLEITNAPVIASHSSCRHFTPGFERNMNDDMIKKLAENNGVIQINFGSYFVDGNYQATETELDHYFKKNNIKRSSKEGKEYRKKLLIQNKVTCGTVEDVVNHIDHVVKLVGINYVGFGSDFDGVGKLPKGVEDASGYPNVIYELLRKGYSEEDIEKICSGNLLRVWKEVELIAEQK